MLTEAGNTTAQNPVRYTKKGQPVCNVTVAVNRRRQNPQTQEWEDHPDGPTFFEATFWDTEALNAASIPKGARVILTGSSVSLKIDEVGDQTFPHLVVRNPEIAVSTKWAKIDGLTKSVKEQPQTNNPADIQTQITQGVATALKALGISLPQAPEGQEQKQEQEIPDSSLPALDAPGF